MTEPQAGIFTEGSRYHYALEYRVHGAHALASVRRALSLMPDARVHRVVAFGPSLARELCGDAVPPALSAFAGVGSDESMRAPSTQADLWIWLHGSHHDLNFDHARALDRALGDSMQRVAEVMGFAREENRDLTGFVDGTANPKGDDRFAAALVADGEPGAGGSFVFTQTWVHDLAAFEALPVKAQEAVIGRTKVDDVELEGDDMPPDSHVARTDVKVDGVAQKIWRRSFPYGSIDRHGLYFVAFACAPSRIQIQLERMYGVAGDGRHDRLVEFSRAVSGSYWFAPGAHALAAALR